MTTHTARFYTWTAPSRAPRQHTVLRLLTREQWAMLTDEQREHRLAVLKYAVRKLGEAHQRTYHPVQAWPECSVTGCTSRSRCWGMCPRHYHQRNDAQRKERRAS